MEDQKQSWNFSVIKNKVPFLFNKYIFVAICFIVLIIFFDRNNLINQYESLQRLNQLKQTKEYYKQEIETNTREMDELSIFQDSVTDYRRLKKLEKFAREKYMMKRANEDLFIIVDKQEEK